MDLNKGANTVASPPALDSGGTAGYFRNQTSGPPWTVVKADFLNGISLELKALIEAGGLTLDSADTAQVLKVVRGALAARADASAVTALSTVLLRVIIASEGSTATGSKSAVVASSAGVASGEGSAVIAALDIAGSPPEASGDGSMVAASSNSHATGTNDAAIASVACTASGGRSAALAAISSTASGLSSLAAATSNSDAIGDNAVALGGEESIATGNGSGVYNAAASRAFGARTMVLAGANVEIATPGMIGGGDNSGAGAITFNGTDQGLKWTVSKEGVGTFLTLALTAVPAGATQGGAGVGAGQLWRTASHATLPDNVLMVGV